ncbi:succinate dehydrogenase/fumarate reductase cytochrome b subunit [Desulfovibrio cuneatus]|uniref:succinate dehydrogenase/fumarate reductase cytochrome b subunit n=1 Tax=Desulfovibrio cuneatus TaxID=159728 RepID=UPI000A045082|nr:succinate dehydrogenase/fumarate reductase cytochrome b subunit [Desulfovibrio cuneatus]
MSDSLSFNARANQGSPGLAGSQGSYVASPGKLAGRLDVLQALSGVLLILFLWAHLLLVSSVIVSPALMNGIGWFFEVTFMAQIGGPVILLLMVFHFIIAARKMPFRTGELCTFWKHAKRLHHKDTWLWLVQVVTAIVILVMASIHVHAVLSTLPITAAKSAERVQNGWLLFYLVLLPMAELHVSIGFYRLGVKYGYISSGARSKFQRVEYYMAGTFIVIGLLTLLRFSYLTIS